MKTTIQLLYDKGVFDNYIKVDVVLKDFSFTRRRPDLEKVNDDVIQWFY